MIITTIHEMDSIPALKQAGADGILIGIKGLSVCSANTVEIEALKDWKEICLANQMELYVNACKLMMDSDFDRCKDLIQTCKDLSIDGIYFSDEGLLYIAKEMGYTRLVYQPETLIANHRDVEFYLNQGCLAVSLAHELSLAEIQQISVAGGCEVLIDGYFSILYSRRPLITNYLDAIDRPDFKKRSHLDLIEQTRLDRMPIVEDETGTHIFSEQPIQSIQEIASLESFGIKRFRIDSFLKDDAWTIQFLNAYRQGTPIDGSNHWYYQNTTLKKEDTV